MSSGVRFVDTCLVARDIFSSLGPLPAPEGFPVKIRDFLVPTIAARMSTEGQYGVQLSARDWESVHLYSMLVRGKSDSTIYYNSKLNTCWKRYVVCKELAHLLLDVEESHFTDDPVSLVQQLITNVPFSEWDELVTSEYMATFVAVEVLLPWKYRKELQQMQRDGKTDLQIAHYCRVPEKYVSLVLSSKYGELSRSTNEKLDRA